MKAHQTIVSFGTRQIIALMDEQKYLYIATPSMVDEQILNRQDHASRDLKTLLGKESKIAKLSVIGMVGKPVSAITVEQFVQVLKELSKRGHKVASDFISDLVDVSLTQTIYRAFGVKFDEEDWQNKLIQKEIHRTGYQPLCCRWWKEDGIESGNPYAMRMRRLKRQAGLPEDVSIIDYNYSQLSKLNQAEYAYDLLRKAGMTHDQAIILIR